MNWEPLNGVDQYVLRAEGQPEDLAIVWGINSSPERNHEWWHWYVIGKKSAVGYDTKEEAMDQALAEIVARRMSE